MANNSLKSIHRLIQVATKQEPVEKRFLGDLNSTIERANQAEKRIPSKCYKPSSMKCIRNMYFQVIGEQQDEDRASATLVGICETGSARHESIQSAVSKMKKYGIDCEYINVADFVKMRNLTDIEVKSQIGFETKLYHKKLNISFMCDGIIKYDGHYYILEIKTETSNKWFSRDAVAEEHRTQAIAYSLCLGINDILFLYESRDTTDKKTYLITITDDMKYEVVDKIETCDSHVSKLTPPPKPSDINKKTCEYCSYKAACRRS